jgi:N-acetylmuramoyl-L-alanine amidase
MKKAYQFSVLKKWRDRLCWGPGARTERAGSIGRDAPWLRRSDLVSSRRGGRYLPRPIHEEISALWFQASRSGPRALEALSAYKIPFFKELRCYKKSCFLFSIFLLLLSLLNDGEAAVPVLKIRHWSDAEYTRIVIDLGGRVPYRDQSTSGSETLSIQINGVSLPQGKSEIAIQDRVIRTVTISAGEKESAEIRISLARPTRHKIFTLSAAGNLPHRLVIDVFRPGMEPSPKIEGPASPPPRPDAVEKPRETAEAPPEKTSPSEISKAPEKEAVSSFPKVLEIRQWAAPDHSRVVVDLEGAPSYEILPASDPLTVGVLLRRTTLAKGRQEISVSDQIIRKMVAEPAGKDGVQIFLSLIKPGRANVFSLKPYQDKPDRLVIDVYRPDLEEKEKAERKGSQELKTKKTRIVVIDPGHGGEDPGAIGPNGTREKDVVLAVARKLQKTLDETGEFKAFLTRRGDYFVALYDRVRIAMEYGADLFISLHANGNTSRSVRGTSVYCLSPKGASDKAAQLLAQKENAADIVGGASTGTVRKDLDSILFDLELTHTINESLQLGGIMLGELRQINLVQTPHPLQGGFAVLRAPNFPSILVELAYVTHPVEEKNLKRDKFQSEAAQAIVSGVKKFLPVLALKEEENIPNPKRVKGAQKGS